MRRHLILRMMKPQLEISASILTECLLYQLRIQTVDLNVNFHNTYKLHNKEHLCITL